MIMERSRNRVKDELICGVVVIVLRNGHGNTSSNPGRDLMHFT